MQNQTTLVYIALMNLKALYLTRLSDEQRQQFCALAETSDAYMRVHLVHRRRIPRPALMTRLATACQQFDPTITRYALLAWFYEEPQEAA